MRLDRDHVERTYATVGQLRHRIEAENEAQSDLTLQRALTELAELADTSPVRVSWSAPQQSEVTTLDLGAGRGVAAVCSSRMAAGRNALTGGAPLESAPHPVDSAVSKVHRSDVRLASAAHLDILKSLARLPDRSCLDPVTRYIDRSDLSDEMKSQLRQRMYPHAIKYLRREMNLALEQSDPTRAAKLARHARAIFAAGPFNDLSRGLPLIVAHHDTLARVDFEHRLSELLAGRANHYIGTETLITAHDDLTRRGITPSMTRSELVFLVRE